MQNARFIVLAALAGAGLFIVTWLIDNAYIFFAGYVVLQYIVLATAWNILAAMPAT